MAPRKRARIDVDADVAESLRQLAGGEHSLSIVATNLLRIAIAGAAKSAPSTAPKLPTLLAISDAVSALAADLAAQRIALAELRAALDTAQSRSFSNHRVVLSAIASTLAGVNEILEHSVVLDADDAALRIVRRATALTDDYVRQLA